MDLIKLLQMFTGGGSVKGAAQGAMSKQGMPMQSMSRQVFRTAVPMQAQTPTRSVTPGYEEAAKNYEAAFDRGDYNSPYIIGQDPKNFGYAEDIMPAQTVAKNNRSGVYSRQPSPALLDFFKLRR